MTLTIRAAVMGSVLVVLPVSMAAGQDPANTQQGPQPPAAASMTGGASLADPTVGAITICVVPGSGTVYRVGVTGAPAKCLQASHQLLRLNLAGVHGEMGPAGAAGEAGPAGTAGAAGATGSAGVAGETGPMGPAGPIGPAGAVGLAGTAGAIGAPGVAGPSGPAGAAGATGADGAAGAVGPAGPVGPVGADGEQGSVGPAGAAGAAGSQGPQGLIGLAGVAGEAGPTGDTGAKGDAGGIAGYERVLSGAVSVRMGQTTTVSKSCSAGKSVIGGGFTVSSPMEMDTMVSTFQSYPSADDTWTVRVGNSYYGMGMDITVTAYAICVAGSPPD